MTGWCESAHQSSGLTGSVVRYIDCQAQTLGSAPYHALAAPGSTLSVVLTGFLTIFIALIGYNLLLGRSLTVRSGVLAALHVGAVFALATSWPVYSTLVYDVVIDGPAQITADIGRPAGIPGSDGSLLQRVDLADGALAQLAIEGVGIGIRDDIPPPPFSGFNAFALGGSRILFLLTAVGALASVRIVAGFLLALGPFFITFLLFDSTRSLFEGWIRVLAGAALAAVGASISLGLELAFLEPWLADALARRMAGESLPSMPVELLVVAGVFSVIVAAVLVSCVWLARAFRMTPPLVPGDERREVTATHFAGEPQIRTAGLSRDERTRAQAVGDVLVTLQRREAVGRNVGSGPRVVAVAGVAEGSAFDARQTHVPVGRSFRRARPRLSASSGRRDSK
jgi:type IV secretion system protein VirB6